MKRNWFIPSYHYRAWHRRLFFWLFDTMGCLIRLISMRRKPVFEASRIQRILAIRNDHLGDFLMAIPAIKALKIVFPEAKIDLLVSADAGPLAKTLPDIHEVYEFKASWFSKKFIGKKLSEARQLAHEFRKNKYDLAIDFRGDLRNIILMFRSHIPFRLSYGVTGGGFLLSSCPPYPQNEHQVMVNLKLLQSLGFTVTPPSTSFKSSPESKEKILKYFPRLFSENPKPLLVIHPSAGYPSKRWPIDYFKNLMSAILDQSLAKIVLIGSAMDRDLFDFSDFDPVLVQDLRGKCPLTDLPALFEVADLYLGNDSGPAHVAALTNIQSVILFSGTNEPHLWRPWSKQTSLLTHPVNCSPCHAKECPLKHHACMKEIRVEDVLQALKPHLRTYSIRPAQAAYEI